MRSFVSRCRFIFALCLGPAAFAAAPPVVQFTLDTFSYQEKECCGFYPRAYFVRTGDTSTSVGVIVDVLDEATGTNHTYGVDFSAGQTQTDLTVNGGGFVSNDNVYNPPRKWKCTITQVNFGSATIGTPSVAEVVIVDDELPPTVLLDDASMIEASAPFPGIPALVGIRLTTPVTVDTYFPLTAHDGTAKAGKDYSVPPVAFIKKGQNFGTIYVEIVPDNEPEGDETFTLEIGPPSPPIFGLVMSKSTATVTILDDDPPVTPASQRVPRDSKATIYVRFADPAVANETLSIQTPDSFLGVPPSVVLPAGSTTVNFDVGTSGVGSGTVYVTVPASRGGRTFATVVTAFDPIAFSVDPLSLPISIGGDANINVKLDPPPATPIVVALTQSKPSVVDIPASVTVDASGTAKFSVHGFAVGSSTITATLPETSGATALTIQVSVTVPSGLAITNLSQRSGRTSGGDSMQIFGNNISGRCVVAFGGIPSPNTATPANGGITAITPPHDAGVVDITLRCGANTFVLTNAFTFTAAPPTGLLFSPLSGTTRGGTVVALSGVNLRYGECMASFGGVLAHTLTWTGTTSLLVSTPAHAQGLVPITLTCGNDTTSVTSFNYVAVDDAPPAISFVSPLKVAPGDRVVIGGSRFRVSDVVSLDTNIIPNDIPLTSSSSRTITIPDLAPGTYTTTIRDDAGRTTTGPKIEITAPNAPAITQIDARVTSGAEFTVRGTAMRRSLSFAFGLATIQPVSITNTSAVFRAPNVPPGSYNFTISDHGTQVVSRPVDVTSSGLAVTSISPPCASRDGGLIATIAGAGFTSGAIVLFDSTASADAAVRDGFTIFARVPPAFAGATPVITIVNPDGTQSTLTNAFTYKAADEGSCAPHRRATGH